MNHLRNVRVGVPATEAATRFPFSVPAIRELLGRELTFTAPVTFLVGENGSGKSTLLEALACAARAVTVGSAPAEQDDSLSGARQLASVMRLSWARRTHRGFFLRSEDFFGYARRMQSIREDAENTLRELDADQELSPTARAFARIPHASTVHAIRQRYGEGLDQVSHGESYFALFRSRMVPNGLYLLDEPEAPLSPTRQIGLLSLMKEQVEQHNAQFIIATHAPILMAYPGATILSFDGGTIHPVSFDAVEHVRLLRDFLHAPERFLRHI